MKNSSSFAAWILPALLLAGCGKPPPGSSAERIQMHHAVPPHGGTPVALGDDYRLELVRDAATGTLSAYVLDDDMEEFIRCPAPSITLVAHVKGEDRPLALAAIANAATGETVGDSSLFQGRADWLKDEASFSATLQSLTIRGTPFTGISFPFPEGNAPD